MLSLALQLKKAMPGHLFDRLTFDKPTKVKYVRRQRCLAHQRHRLLVLTTSVFEVLRFIPPLTLSEAEAAEASDIFADALREVASPA